jgi:hypothetical protein
MFSTTTLHTYPNYNENVKIYHYNKIKELSHNIEHDNFNHLYFVSDDSCTQQGGKILASHF